MEQNLSVRKASKILKIKYTTAKALVQKYRMTGTIDRQRARRTNIDDDAKEELRGLIIKSLPIGMNDSTPEDKLTS
jgi:transposase